MICRRLAAGDDPSRLRPVLCPANPTLAGSHWQPKRRADETLPCTRTSAAASPGPD